MPPPRARLGPFRYMYMYSETDTCANTDWLDWCCKCFCHIFPFNMQPTASAVAIDHTMEPTYCTIPPKYMHHEDGSL